MQRPGWIPRFWERDARFELLAPVARRFADDLTFPAVEVWTERLGDLAGVRFEKQSPRGRRRRNVDPGALYDARISREGVVPSRADHWHDFLNALVWATFPRAKRALHARQHRAIAALIDPDAKRLPAARTRELDALAILDEGGVVVLSRCEITEHNALANAIENREAVPLIFGHAIYEGFLCGGPDPTTRCAVVPGPPDLTSRDAQISWADAAIAARLADPGSFTDPQTMPHWTVR